MRRLLKTFFPNLYLNRLRAQAEAILYEQWLDSPGSKADSPDDDWLPLGDGSDKSPASDAPALALLRSRSRQLVQTQPHAAAALNMYVHFVVGDGLQINPDTGNDSFDRKASDNWIRFSTLNQFDERFREIVLRTFRDGECFIRRFVTPDGIRLRFIDPEDIVSPSDRLLNAPQGIRFSETDAETPIEYFVAVHNSSTVEIESVDASEILHIKLGVDSNAARGIPLLTPVIARLKQYDNWLQSLLALHSVRSAVALVKRYVSSSPGDILSQASRSATTTANADGRTTRRQKLQPGSIIHASAGVEYQMLSPNIQATDADVLGRAILLSVASGLGLSETMLTADSNNANYASSVVAETPAFMAFRAHQRRFCARTAIIYRWMIENAIATGRLNAVLPDDPYSVRISASPMPTRDIESRVRAACELYDRGLLDKDSMLQKTNF